MPTTKLLTVNDVGNPEPVTAETTALEIIIGEDASVVGYPTTAFIVRRPSMTSDAVRVPAGKLYCFRRGNGTVFDKGQVVGYVETVTGSTTFSQDEH